jgi:hypothetical protein
MFVHDAIYDRKHVITADTGGMRRMMGVQKVRV